MSLTVLSVAYPFAPVSRDAVGGAEQVLSHLDEALSAAGCRSIVVACEGSRASGVLMPVSAFTDPADEQTRGQAYEAQRRAVALALRRWPVDLIHMHGLDFSNYLPPPGLPVLVTLHMPISWYPAEALRPLRPDTWFNCVSRQQHEACPRVPGLLAPIENGVPIPDAVTASAKSGFCLVLSRICPEKGIHVAIEAAKRANVSLLIAGQVFDYPDHRRYFEEEVVPRLDHRRRFIGPVGFAQKQRLLAAARCVLVPSLAPETSSLVAREALAAGTPVVAMGTGALAETVEHGRTGFLVRDEQEMAAAIGGVAEIDPAVCRAVAEARFSVEQMVARYLDLYRRLARSEPAAAAGSVP
ncbi:glycosyltransferase family 4 protein [Rhodoligotrophos defluvii]|uniref:glycosyltransferase family 4 protein n=1 Tax=Rhodoligotrophos defluvii TaxID=2561934 RepID=UPI0010C93E76|nr:glycosyltransferase family 4 protein [Rhodoligotrophos defluvii]